MNAAVLFGEGLSLVIVPSDQPVKWTLISPRLTETVAVTVERVDLTVEIRVFKLLLLATAVDPFGGDLLHRLHRAD